jgi:hypothetical protein
VTTCARTCGAAQEEERHDQALRTCGRHVAPVALGASACAPLFGGAGSDDVTSLVTLPSGEVCGYAGGGATLAFDGLRLSWTCEVAPTGPRGLLGDPVILGETNVSWRLASTARRSDGAGFELARLDSIDGRVVRFVTVTGSTCSSPARARRWPSAVSASTTPATATPWRSAR